MKLIVKLPIFLLLMYCGAVQASTASGVYLTDGGKTVNLSGLEWLSLDQTAGLSRNTVQTNLGNQA